MMLTKLKWAGAAVLVSGLALTGAGVMARQDAKPQQDDSLVARASADVSAAAKPANAAGAAVPNLSDLRAQLLTAARIEWTTAYKDYHTNITGLERAYQASRRLKDAEEQNAGPSPREQGAPARAHFDRIRDIARLQQHNPSSSELQLAQLKSFESEAELWLAKAKEIRADEPASPDEETGPQYGNAQPKPRRPELGSAPAEGRGQDPRSRRILAKLEDQITMSFHDETPLEDILKYIKQATASPEHADGIPIYVDPIGLQEAEKSMTSTVRNMDLKGVPLRRTLQLLLKQLDLIYFVDDGILCITSAESEDTRGTFGPSMAEPSPLNEKIDKAERGELTLDEMKELIELLKTREEVRELAEPHEGGQVNAGGFGRSASASDEAKRNQELVELLVKETRELIDVLNAAKPTKKDTQELIDALKAAKPTKKAAEGKGRGFQ